MKKSRIFALLALCGLLAGLLAAQPRPLTLSGTVTDAADGSPLHGAVVTVEEDPRIGTSTDARGRYSLTVPGGATLLFSFLGYETQGITASVARLDVALVPEEIVVIDDIYPLDDTYPIVWDEELLQTESVMDMKVAGIQAEFFSSAPLTRQGVYDAMPAEEYASFRENRFIPVASDPLSTFALEVDGASYSNVRRMINAGQLPEADAVRVEEMVNYFSYDYPQPAGADPVRISYEVAACPWNPQHRLVRVGVKAREIPSDNLPKSNFVFLIDVSGSMYGPTRLELVKSSLKLLVNNLRDDDRVSIVVYAGAAGEVLPSTPGSDRQRIREALDNLTAGGSTAGGSTAGGAGIQLAYNVARRNFIQGGNNRVILCTDGDFNVGVSSSEGLEQLIERERRSGVFLTVLGYGMGNYKDARLQTLAEKGNGNHAYIDNIQEANRVLVNEFGSTMYTVAKDVKLQIEFNPSRVQAYRLVGYESRLLAHEDFNDDTKDAGELGAGHSVTAFYEVIPAGVQSNLAPGIDPLRYQPAPEQLATAPNAMIPLSKNFPDMMLIKLRYKAPDGDTSRLIEVPVVDNGRNRPSADYHFASAVAMFGQLLKDSDFKGTGTYAEVIRLARQGLSDDPHGYRREFVRLAEAVSGMAR